MALAAAREILGPVPCTLEDIEFQKFLVLDQNVSPSVQLEFDPASSEFAVYSHADDSNGSGEVHARGWVRPRVGPISKKVDLRQIRERCPESFDREECQRRFAAAGYHYGPAFQGMEQLWRGEREMLAEVLVPAVLKERLSDYRLHPAVLDACFQTMLAAFPTWTNERGLNGEIFVPVKIERIRFHASPDTRMFAHTRVTNLSPTELKVDLHVVDAAGDRLVDVEGLTARQAGYRAQGLSNTLYEYQWKPSPRETVRAGRDSGHLPSPEVLTGVLQQEGETLRQRFDRARFQNEFQARSRAVAVAYIARALRQLGWTPMPPGKQPIETLADRLGIAPHYRRWLELMLKELTAARSCLDRGAAPPLEGAVERLPGMSSRVEAPAALRREPFGSAAERRGPVEPDLPGGIAERLRKSSIRILRLSVSTTCSHRRRSSRSLDAPRREGRCGSWR